MEVIQHPGMTLGVCCPSFTGIQKCGEYYSSVSFVCRVRALLLQTLAISLLKAIHLAFAILLLNSLSVTTLKATHCLDR